MTWSPASLAVCTPNEAPNAQSKRVWRLREDCCGIHLPSSGKLTRRFLEGLGFTAGDVSSRLAVWARTRRRAFDE
jgi:hypothetical protein